MQKKNTEHIEMVLSCVKKEQITSRAEIAKKLSLSKPTVSKIVNQLIDEDWVFETGTGEASTSGGRKPVKLKFNPRKAFVIGVDIGGTKVAVGILDLVGNVCAYSEFPTQQYIANGFFEQMKYKIDAMIKENRIEKSKILGMGVGIPGITNVESGVVQDAPALGWKNFPVKEKLKEFFDIPIYIDNDVNINVLGEQWKGAGKGKSNLIYIAIGTGIGSGIMINGELYRGSNYSAGEMGYMVTDRQYANKYYPVYEGYGFLESVASGSSIGNSLTRKLGYKITADEAFSLYEQGNSAVKDVIEEAVDHLSIGIANYISLLDPEVVIVGGGVSGSFSLFEQTIKDAISHYTPQKCKVVKTTFGKEAGVIGAVALFLKEYGGIFKI